MGLVYCIKNKINGKCYIGQTTKTFKQRYSGGKWWRCTRNEYLKRAAIKYGPDSFEVIIVEDNITDINKLNERELHWSNIYCSLHPNGYNLDTCGKNKKVHPDSIAKRAEALSKSVIRSDNKRYSSIRLAAKDLNCRPGAIVRVLKGDRKSIYGFKFIYEGGDVSKLLIVDENRKYKKIKRSDGKIYNSILEAAKDTGTHQNAISKVLHKRCNNTHGYSFAFIDDTCPIVNTQNPNSKKVLRSDNRLFNSIDDAARDLQVAHSSIRAIINGERKTIKGFSFSLLPQDTNESE